MDRIVLFQQFSAADENVSESIERTRRQRERVLGLKRGGQEAEQAQKALVALEDSLLALMADRDRLLSELGDGR
jgi:hypothetical protein